MSVHNRRPSLPAALTVLAAVTLLAAVTAVAGCGGTGRSETARTQRPATAAASSRDAAASPSAAAGMFDLAGTLSLRDPDGYTYTLSYTAGAASGFRADPTNAKPQRTDLVLSATATATVTNTTPSRQAPGGHLGFATWGLYPVGGAVCTAAQTPRHDFYVGGHTRVGVHGSSPRWCAVSLTGALYNYTDPLDPGASIQLQSDEGSGDAVTQTIADVAEADAAALIQALDHPAGFISFMDNGENPNSYSDVTSPLTVTGSCTVDLYLGDQSSPSTITAVPLHSSDDAAPTAACPAS